MSKDSDGPAYAWWLREIREDVEDFREKLSEDDSEYAESMPNAVSVLMHVVSEELKVAKELLDEHNDEELKHR